LLPEVAENPTFPILSALAYTTGLGYRPTCDDSTMLYTHCIATAPVMSLDQDKGSNVLDIDASNYGLGVVLLQIHDWRRSWS